MQKWSHPSACSAVCIESCLPIGWCTFIWWKNPPKRCSILIWIAGCWNSLISNCNPKNNWCLSRIFGARFGRKDCGLSTCKLYPNKQEVGFIFAWSGSELWTLIKYSRSKNQKLKTCNGWCSIQGLSNGTTLMQIKSGQTVPLKSFVHFSWVQIVKEVYWERGK